MSPSDQLPYAYVFVRQDLPTVHQIVQSNHATLSMASTHGYEVNPNIVLIGVPDVEALMEVSRRCSESQIPHYLWREPDFDFGLTAIATAGIKGADREAFAGYSTWRELIHPWPNGKAAASNSEDVGSNPTG